MIVESAATFAAMETEIGARARKIHDVKLQMIGTWIKIEDEGNLPQEPPGPASENGLGERPMQGRGDHDVGAEHQSYFVRIRRFSRDITAIQSVPRQTSRPKSLMQSKVGPVKAMEP
jgi:hypothetical protein